VQRLEPLIHNADAAISSPETESGGMLMAIRPSARVCSLSLLIVLGFGVGAAGAQDGVRCPGEPATMVIGYGDVVECESSGVADTDDFTFSGAEGESIVINAYRGCVTLRAPGGATTNSCSDFAHRLDAVLTATGTYTITVARTPSLINFTYFFALERFVPASPAARPIGFTEPMTDQINVPTDFDLFSFSGTPNQVVAVVMDTPGGVNPVCAELIAPDNSRAVGCSSSIHGRLQATLTQDGTHVIAMRHQASGSGPYTIQLLCISGSCGIPAPPTGLTGTVSTYATTFAWTPAAAGSAATSFVLEAGTSSGATDVMVFDTLSAGTTFVSPGLPNGTYFVRVRARNAAGTSAPSNEIIVSGATGCAPGAPGNLIASVSGLNVAFQWNAAAGSPTSHELEAGTAPGKSNLGTFPVGLTAQFATPAPPGVYYVRIRARNACGVGPASNEVLVLIGQACTTPPTAPPTFTASLAGQVLTLAWAAAGAQPASYIIEAGTASGAANIATLDRGSQLSFVTTVPPGAYFIRVRARNACGIGPASIERMVVVP
jgi:hypothetical protein